MNAASQDRRETRARPANPALPGPAGPAGATGPAGEDGGSPQVRARYDQYVRTESGGLTVRPRCLSGEYLVDFGFRGLNTDVVLMEATPQDSNADGYLDGALVQAFATVDLAGGFHELTGVALLRTYPRHALTSLVGVAHADECAY